jgi:hypothetical protein
MAKEAKFRSGEPVTVDDAKSITNQAEQVLHLSPDVFHGADSSLKHVAATVVDARGMVNTHLANDIHELSNRLRGMTPKQGVSVNRTLKQDFVKVGDTQYAVSGDWADAFAAIVEANGKPIGIKKRAGGGGYIRQPSEDIKLLPQALQDTIERDGNKGWFLKPEFCA